MFGVLTTVALKRGLILEVPTLDLDNRDAALAFSCAGALSPSEHGSALIWPLFL